MNARSPKDVIYAELREYMPDADAFSIAGLVLDAFTNEEVAEFARIRGWTVLPPEDDES